MHWYEDVQGMDLNMVRWRNNMAEMIKQNMGSKLPTELLLKIREQLPFTKEDRYNEDYFNFSLALGLPIRTHTANCFDELPFSKYNSLDINEENVASYEDSFEYPPGLCYLSSIRKEHRVKALMKLGYYPWIMKLALFWMYNDMVSCELQIHDHMFHVKRGWGSLLNISYGMDGVVYSRGIQTIQGMGLSRHLLEYLQNNPNMWCVSGDDRRRVGAEGIMSHATSLHDVLQPQGEGLHHSEYHTFYSSSTLSRQVDLTLSGSGEKFSLVVDDRRLMVNKGNRTNKEWVQYLHKIRHDWVADELTGGTDVSLKEIGIDIELTPDCIDKSSRRVLELSTVAVSERVPTERAHLSKVVAYGDILDNAGVQYYILVVSPTFILFNGQLPQRIVDLLCQRCREGIVMDAKLKPLIGESFPEEVPGNEEFSESLWAMSQINKRKMNDLKSYKRELMDMSSRDNTELEDEMAMNKLEETFKISQIVSDDPKPHSMLEFKQNMTSRGTREDMKRIINFPALRAKRCQFDSWRNDGNLLELGNNVDVPPELYRLASEGFSSWQAKYHLDIDQSHLKAMNEASTGIPETEQHNMRHLSEFHCKLAEEDLIKIALSGPGAKSRSHLKEIQQKEAHGKLGFDPYTNTDDIEKFLKDNSLASGRLSSEFSVSWKATMQEKKRLDKESLSIKMIEKLRDHPIIEMSEWISEAVVEMSYEYKVPHGDEKWSIKHLPNYPIFLLLKATGSHIFCSFILEKGFVDILDTGRIGPTLWETEKYIISDWCSYLEVTLEHFAPCEEYIIGMGTHLLKHFGVSPWKLHEKLPSELYRTLAWLFLMFLNDKSDVEEMVTSSRFLYMKLFQIKENSPYRFISRLPEVLRSRLSVHMLKSIEKLMAFYEERKPYKAKVRRHRMVEDQEEDPGLGDEPVSAIDFEYRNLRSLFHDKPVTFSQLVDSFYFGYVVSKTKGKAGDRSYKIVAKIMKEHYWYQDNIEDKKETLWAIRNAPLRHCWDPCIIRYMCKLVEGKCNRKWGGDFRVILHERILRAWSRLTLSEIASLKASSKDHSKLKINVVESKSRGKARVKEIKELNPELQGKRPRVITALSKLIHEYIAIYDDHNPTYLKILVYSANTLIDRGWFYSDLFPKDQHGGDREIHVIEIAMRVWHYAMEKIALLASEMVGSDSVSIPKLKEKFMSTHEDKAQVILGKHVTLCKSADASKWCQRHHVSKFFFTLNQFIRMPLLAEVLYLFYRVWCNKVIAMPEELVSIMQTSEDITTENELFKRLREDFWAGRRPFLQKEGNKFSLEDGMLQGLPHRASSFIHDIPQVSMAIIIEEFLLSKDIVSVCSVIQGSDDSAMMISYNQTDPKITDLVYTCLKWKEEIGKYWSIWVSDEKTSYGTFGMVEYNSEWWFSGHYIRPTFRWVSASLSVNLFESFTERVRNFYNLATTCLENGGSTLSTAAIQLCQSSLHYRMLGLNNSRIGEELALEIMNTSHPAGGFFPLEIDPICGITGFDFAMYYHLKKGFVKANHKVWDEEDPEATLEYNKKTDPGIKDDLRSVEIRFANTKIHERVVKETGLPELSKAVEHIVNNPECLYRSSKIWRDEEAKMAAKLFDRGVKSSLSSHQPTIRSFASSSYIPTRPCLTVSHGLLGASLGWWERPKKTLWQVNLMLRSTGRKADKDSSPTRPEEFFIRGEEYLNYYKEIQKWVETYHPIRSNMKSRGKVIYTAWSSTQSLTHPLIDICRRQWFYHNTVKISKTVFKQLWGRAKFLYPFLRDSHNETCKHSGLDPMQLKNVLLRIEKGSRELIFTDTLAKQGSRRLIVSRTYWPSVKLLLPLEQSDSSLLEPLSVFSTISHLPISKREKFNLLGDYTRDFSGSGKWDFDLSRLRGSAQKLGMLMKFWMNGNFESLLNNIYLYKQGVQGVFTTRQNKEIEQILTKGGKMVESITYSKVGLWQGRVQGSNVRIEMQENTCTKIMVDSIRDNFSLSNTLRDLILEFGLKAKELIELIGPTICLTESGSFILCQGLSKNVIPVYKSDEIRELMLDMSDAGKDAWIDVSPGWVRIKIRVQDFKGLSRETTVLGIRLDERYWTPHISNLFSIGEFNPSLRKWLDSEPAELFDLLDDLDLVHATGVKLQYLLDVGADRLSSYNHKGIMMREYIEELRRCLSWDIERDLEEAATSRLNMTKFVGGEIGLKSAMLGESDFIDSNSLLSRSRLSIKRIGHFLQSSGTTDWAAEEGDEQEIQNSLSGHESETGDGKEFENEGLNDRNKFEFRDSDREIIYDRAHEIKNLMEESEVEHWISMESRSKILKPNRSSVSYFANLRNVFGSVYKGVNMKDVLMTGDLSSDDFKKLPLHVVALASLILNKNLILMETNWKAMINQDNELSEAISPVNVKSLGAQHFWAIRGINMMDISEMDDKRLELEVEELTRLVAKAVFPLGNYTLGDAQRLLKRLISELNYRRESGGHTDQKKTHGGTLGSISDKEFLKSLITDQVIIESIMIDRDVRGRLSKLKAGHNLNAASAILKTTASDNIMFALSISAIGPTQGKDLLHALWEDRKPPAILDCYAMALGVNLLYSFEFTSPKTGVKKVKTYKTKIPIYHESIKLSVML
jgi:hypothetical protein